MKAVFSTWPEDKQTVAEEEHLCGASTSSQVSGPAGSQLEAGEITEEHEDGEISDEDDLQSKTQGLKDLLRQSIGGLQSSGVQDEHSTGSSPGGRWRKNSREQNTGKVAIDLASLL